MNLYQGKLILDTRKNFLTKKVVRHQSRLPREVATAPSLPEFKCSDNALIRMI